MRKKTPLLSIVIPSFNAKRTIHRSILDAKANAKKFFKDDYEVLFADNGSTDGTLDILKKEKGIKVINAPVRGYGGALHWGITNAKGKFVLFADDDLSYPFSNLAKFKSALADNPDLVLGTRLKGYIGVGAMPYLHRYFGTPVLTWLIRIMYRIPTTDCNSGMRMVKKSFYKKLNMKSSGMEWASELLLKTALKRGKYTEVPITYLKDKRGRPPGLSTWPDGWRQFKTIILLRAGILWLFLAILIIGGIFFYRVSFVVAFLLLDLAAILFLSILTLKLLESVIEKRSNPVADFLSRFLLVPFTLGLSLVVGTLILFLPDSHMGAKLFLVSLLGIIFMWIFLIETIKTHLVNRLPDGGK